MVDELAAYLDISERTSVKREVFSGDWYVNDLHSLTQHASQNQIEAANDDDWQGLELHRHEVEEIRRGAEWGAGLSETDRTIIRSNFLIVHVSLWIGILLILPILWHFFTDGPIVYSVPFLMLFVYLIFAAINFKSLTDAG